MNVPTTYLAHGGLGVWDEVTFLGVGVLFLVMMGISWMRSRSIEPQSNIVEDPSEGQTEERFRLD